eukprot:CAMPEP_0175912000 /NCGR_PEP_ID=MMETSP0108-20121206/8492_1 /TAXON_ID=195067 ORGANISM="Goniomonas pacifica, Strain CCMP1869" /NCGR_SAMPLE_ID=MMETSP0108 /ASSEMBLY_ACC=CAM_ASM_000204 /LENGTH=53 /DNA_ID=CAMNT_0017234281 /DNA_START=176 /DNA_END=333 /DNA_ORIENTATION=+
MAFSSDAFTPSCLPVTPTGVLSLSSLSPNADGRRDATCCAVSSWPASAAQCSA